MSADNYTKCPSCIGNVNKEREKIDKAYGKVSLEEYNKMLLDFEEMDQSPPYTLREDYDIGIHDGIFEIDYRASCCDCQFVYKYKKSIDVMTGKEV